jgi:ABC-type phosphate/phosphonate transport system substrate-binding protein
MQRLGAQQRKERMMMTRIVTIGLALMLLMGCASASKMNAVQLGMTKDQVIGAIGDPSSTSQMGNTQYLKYQLCTDWIFTDRYFVQLTDGKVDAFGRVGDFNLGY